MSTVLDHPPIEDISVVDESMLNGDVPCASHYCREWLGRPTHEAHFTSRHSCGHGIPVCRERVAAYRTHPNPFVRCVADGFDTHVSKLIITPL